MKKINNYVAWTILVVAAVLVAIMSLCTHASPDSSATATYASSTPKNALRYSIDYYKSLSLNTPLATITSKIGKPDADIGSGIHIFVYKLPHNEAVWIGSADLQKLMYVKQKKADGTFVNLLYNR